MSGYATMQAVRFASESSMKEMKATAEKAATGRLGEPDRFVSRD